MRDSIRRPINTKVIEINIVKRMKSLLVKLLKTY